MEDEVNLYIVKSSALPHTKGGQLWKRQGEEVSSVDLKQHYRSNRAEQRFVATGALELKRTMTPASYDKYVAERDKTEGIVEGDEEDVVEEVDLDEVESKPDEETQVEDESPKVAPKPKPKKKITKKVTTKKAK